MANETILIVDADTKSQKVLEVSFKKAGYRVVMTDNTSSARELLREAAPDIIISDTAFPSGGDGFDFLADVRSGESKAVPFIFLTEERSLPQKMRGFELGVDDYLTKPVYIKEVTTRVELLLQKRAKEALLEDDVEEMEGNLADITMIDLLQTIEEELRSGTIHLSTPSQSAVIYFREGNILDAVCGKLQGEEAIYRLMLWPEGEFVLRYHDQVRRIDRIEKDSGALLLEGIRRLDKYNELVDQLPELSRILDTDFQRLTSEARKLPDEVHRIARLFDGLRTIEEVCDGSPLDDVTTLKIVRRLLDDGILVDVTPTARQRERQPSRSNLAAWLEGVRKPSDEEKSSMAREDTSPKFGSSIHTMLEKRDEPDPIRETLDQAGPSAVRQTDPFIAFDDDDDDDEDFETKDPRRKTNIQWDIRPKSDWNIHFDEGTSARDAILEIEEEERRRREEEARQLVETSAATASDAEVANGSSTRESTLRFAPAVERQADTLDDEIMRQIEDDERRRREEEAKRLQAQLVSFAPAEGPVSPALRRKTAELPIQPRIPAIGGAQIEPEDLRDTQPDHKLRGERGRISTPLSAPASFAAVDEPADEAPPAGLHDVSEADVFEDDSDESPRAERATLDIRPPTELVPLGADSGSDPEVTPDIDPAGLFDGLGDDDTAPAEDDYEIIGVETLDSLPPVARQAVDNEIVHAEYDLSLRKSITPYEIPGRRRMWERETVELPHRREEGGEEEFFQDRVSTDRFEAYQAAPERPSLWLAGVLAALVVVAVVLIGYVITADDAEEPAIEITTTTEEPADPVELPPVDPPRTPDPAMEQQERAEESAETLAGGVGVRGVELSLVMSGNPPEAPPAAPDAAVETPTREEPPENGVAEATPATETSPDVTASSPPETPPSPPDDPPAATEEPKIEVPSEVKPGQVREAERLVQRERYDEALQLLRALSKAAPDDKKIAYLHGTAAFNAQRNSEGVEYLAKAERLGHREASLYIELAAAYRLDGKAQRARWAYEKFLKLQPEGKMAEEVRNILATQF